MIAALSLVLTLGVCSSGQPDAPSLRETGDSTYRRLYESGQTFADFVAHANRRKAEWEGNHAKGVAPDALVTRLAAAGDGWKLLVITVPGCSDSVNSIPWLASLVDRAPGIEMRLVDRSDGLSVMEAHRTPDGRAATPTVILLDRDWNERGCWIERPAPLIAWLAEHEETLSANELFNRKMQWYERDAGATSLEEIVVMIESAARGGTRCG